MEQHPIPQQISSYEFKLVGDMTLKQFLKAAAGIILAIIINRTNIIVLVKWPLMLISAGIGLILAFVPFEDRPLEVWIKSFIKSIYSPTIFLYKKRNDSNWLDLDFTRGNAADEAEKPIKNENLFVDEAKVTPGSEAYINRERKKYEDGVTQARKQLSQEVIKEEEEKTERRSNQIDSQKTSPRAVTENLEAKVEIKKEETDWRNSKAGLDLKREKLEATGKAVFGTIPMPDRPDTANVVVGMATDYEGKIVDGVIVEIQDEHGIPSRVIKTNSLGQFKISTPLANGRYLIIAEKDGYTFDRVNIDLSGKIIDPIRIIAHN